MKLKSSKEPVTKAQITKIWASSRELNLPKDHLYEMIFSLSEKESMRDLTKEEAHKVIEELVRLGASSGKKKRYKKTRSSQGNIVAIMTPAQKSKILAQMYALGWTKQTLNDFAEKITTKKLKVKRLSFIRWEALSKEYASDLIEALKAILEKRKKQRTE
ncbi:MAG: hypothetical protein IEMM0008_1016 [bacterium]|nr:MAG: hypothetical protein IEMM0008_1016 [bacterium]